MKDYIINVFSVVIIAVILSLLIPKGRMAKSIKSILTCVISLVIIMPFSKLNYGEFLDNLSSTQDINYQIDYLDYVYEKKNLNYEKNIDEILSEYSILNAKSKIKYSVNEKNEYLPISVNINLANANYDIPSYNNNKIKIIEKIQILLNIEKEYVNFDE